ncbi:MAG: nitroreductase family deazaflavin-dependent oxidoreductase [Acidimicrobiia bacterium]
MLKRAAILAGALFLMLLTISIVFIVGMRRKSLPVLNAVRRVNRRVFNPRQRSAGTPGAYASVIRHAGRTTGKTYTTPVAAVATGDGFVIALPYGSHADWVKNVLAAGSATIVDEGHTFPVDRPEIIPMETVADRFPPKDRRSHRLFGVDQCLRVRRAEPEAASEQP